MANGTTATLIIYGKTTLGWRRGTIVPAKNGVPRPGILKVDSKELEATKWVYQIRTYVNRKAKYVSVGTDYKAATAWLEKMTLTRQRESIDAQLGTTTPKSAEEVESEKEAKRLAQRKTLEELRPTFIDKYAHGSADTVYAYTYVSGEFTKLMAKRRKLYAEELTEDDVIAFARHLEAIGNQKSTRSTRYGYVRCFLRFVGIDPTKLITQTEHQKMKAKDKLAVQTYKEYELEALYAASSPRHRLIWRCYRELGLRDEELAFAFWSDVNFEDGMWQVRFKPVGSFAWDRKLSWKSKDCEERDIPISDGLLEELRELRKSANLSKSNLVFPTSGNQADIKLLKALKSDWRRAGLNCGHCTGCLNPKRKRQECSRPKLKTFRATYLSTMLRHTHLRNVQALAGHSSIETTQRYLAADNPKTLRGAANAAFSAQL